MKINKLSKLAILSLFSLGLASAPVLAASTADAKSKVTKTAKQKKATVKASKVKSSAKIAKSKKTDVKSKATSKAELAKTKKIPTKSSTDVVNAKKDKMTSKAKVAKSKTSDVKTKAKKNHKMSNQVVNINKANKSQLISSLNGVGEKKAQAIIDYRKKHGAFKSTAGLLQVKGIGAKIIEKNKANISLSGAAIKNRKGTTKNVANISKLSS